MKNRTSTTKNKREIRQDMHLTRPPRMEGVVKEAMMQPKKKPKTASLKPKKKPHTKSQETHSEAQRKEYHLRTPKPKRAARSDR